MRPCVSIWLICILLTALPGCQEASGPSPVEQAGTANVVAPEAQQNDSDGSAESLDSWGQSSRTSLLGPNDPGLFLRLAPGDEAPTLTMSGVVHGPDIRPFDGGHVLAVNFWATWRQSRHQSLLHLTELQQKFGEQVQCVSITDESEYLLREFLGRSYEDQTWADVVQHSLAYDSSRSVFRNYMTAAGRRSRPMVFLIDRTGTIAWIGDPEEMDGPLEAIVDRRWDVDSAREKFLEPPRRLTSQLADDRLPPLELEPGMPAPTVHLRSVAHGPAVAIPSASGKVQLLLFFSTWCRHSRIALESTGSLLDRVSSFAEAIAITSEDASTVSAFLRSPSMLEEPWARRIRYTVALDNDAQTWNSYAAATGHLTVPCAVIIDSTGRVAWAGDGRQAEGPMLQVISGTFDVNQAATALRVRRELVGAAGRQDHDRIYELMELLTDPVGNDSLFKQMYLTLLARRQEYDSYNRVARDVIDLFGNEPQLMNNIGWEIATEQPESVRDLDLAMQAAVLANEYSRRRDGPILDTLARVHYEMGDLQSAIHWQRRAVMRFRGPDVTRMLHAYEQELAASLQSSE